MLPPIVSGQPSNGYREESGFAPAQLLTYYKPYLLRWTSAWFWTMIKSPMAMEWWWWELRGVSDSHSYHSAHQEDLSLLGTSILSDEKSLAIAH